MREQITRQATAAHGASLGHDQPIQTTAPSPLSEREMDVARLLVTGAGNAEIARDLVISPHTVKVHLRNIFEKLGVNSRTEATLVLLQRGWVAVPGVEPPPRLEEETIPAPPPVSDLSAPPRPWQVGIVAVTLVLCLFGILLPARGAPPKSAITLLSDSGQMGLGQPVAENLPRWTALAPLPAPRSRLAAVQVDSAIFAVGGEDEDGVTLADVLVYDVGGDRWTALAPLPAPRANLALAQVGDSLIAAGGSILDLTTSATPHVYDDLLRYDLVRNVWATIGQLPGPRAGAGLLVLNEALYLVGGWDGAGLDDGVWALPLARLAEGAVQARDWQRVAQLPSGLAFMGVTVLEGELVVAGGYDGRREVADVAALHVDTGQWRPLPSLNTPRSGLHLVYDGISILAVGGGWTRAVANHERLDAIAGQWVTVPSPIRGEWRHFAATTDRGNVYFIGGWSSDYLETNLRFQSTFRALLPAIPNLSDN